MVEVDDERLQKLLKRWQDVEGSIKRAELLEGQVTLPAINELRYAGRQLLVLLKTLSSERASVAERENAFNKAITNAEQYVTNADHDVIDSVVVFIGRRFEELNTRFGRKAIEDRCAGYKDLGDLLIACRKKVELSRKDVTQRDTLYSEMKRDLDLLIRSWRTLVNADLIMAAEVGMLRKETADAKLSSSLKNIAIVFLTICVVLTFFFRK